MCGIAGIASSGGHTVSDCETAVLRMTDVLSHRGPDDWGTVAWSGDRIIERSMTCPRVDRVCGESEYRSECSVVLGHRRLAIIDLSNNAHQPMGTADGRFWITFNGEIYNYRELRRELKSLGTTFRSTSDTEVLLALYAKEGERCLQRIRGMFAFAVWDGEKQELFLARDRFGMKPLYYARNPHGVFVFASELKALLSSGWASADFDEESETVFLQRGCIGAPKTFYRDIEALQPGHWAKWNGKELTIQSYWLLSKTIATAQNSRSRPWARADTAQEIRHALVETVASHLVSDVPVGVFLSGGLDSTAILGAIRQSYTGPLRTFTLAFPGAAWDESNLARRAAAHYGTEHTELEITKEDFCKDLDEMFLAMDQPTVDGYNTHFVAKCLRQAGGKVALSGLGGDEFLGGYKSFVNVPRLYHYFRAAEQLPWLTQFSGRIAEQLPMKCAPKMAQVLRRAPYSLPALWRHYRALFTDKQIRDLGMLPFASNGSESAGFHVEDPFWAVACLESEHFMVPQLIRDADVFTMRHGVELRMPFVDHVFLSSVLEAGRWTRAGAPSYKAALFQSMDGLFPSNHLRQRKKEFLFPLAVWLRELLSNETSSEVGRQLRAYLDKPGYRPYVEGFNRRKVHWSRIWALYVLERFKTNAGGS